MPRLAWLALLCLVLGGPVAAQSSKVVRVYNWSDYIDETILEDFTKKTGIKVVYDTFDSNDTLETKLLAGNTGYDIVVPTSAFLARQIKAGVFRKLDKSKLPNWKNLDTDLMARVARFDPGNEHAFIYMWGTTGFAYNVDKVKERLPDAPLDSSRMLFDPAVVSKLKDCGVYFLDAADEMLASALAYLGEDPDNKDPAVLEKGAEVLRKVRPYVRKFHSSENINALANGNICIAAIWSGDAGIAKQRAEEAKKKFEIEYVIPKEGGLLWFDMMAIPKDAKNVDNAHAFMNHLMEPEVIAKATNFVTYPNGNAAALPYVDESLRNDPKVYPPDELMAKMAVLTPYDAKTQRLVTRLWTGVKSGK